MNFFVSSMACSFELHSRIAYPAITSLASAYGPSVTASLPLVFRTTVEGDLGSHPPVATRTPDRVDSSTSLFISLNILSLVRSALGEGRHRLMNRISVSLGSWFQPVRRTRSRRIDKGGNPQPPSTFSIFTMRMGRLNAGLSERSL